MRISVARTPEGRQFGYVFIHCRLLAADGVNKVYLGRPWRDFARVVFINSEMGKHIVPQGWSNWGDTSRDLTAYYAEFENTGPGSSIKERLSVNHELTPDEAEMYSKENTLAPQCLNISSIN